MGLSAVWDVRRLGRAPFGTCAVWDVRRLGLSAVWDSAPDRSDPMTFKVSAPSAVTDGVESAVKKWPTSRLITSR